MFLLKSRKAKIWGGSVSLVVALVGYFVWNRDSGPSYEFMTVSRSELVQEVSVTGKIKPAQSVDLQFESSGRISSINYKAGDRVAMGATIVSLENQDLQAAVLSAKADLEKTIRDFNSLNDPAISSSLRIELENAKINLEQAIKKADGDLAADYTSAFNVIREAMTQIDTSSIVLEYLRRTYFQSESNINLTVKDYQEEVDAKMLIISAAFDEIDQADVITPDLYVKMDVILSDLSSACQSLRSAFTYLQVQVQDRPTLVTSSTDRASIGTEAAAISSDLSAVSSAVQSIVDQKITNEKNIADANAKLSTTQASFPTAEDILKKQSALLSAQSQLRKTQIIAPFTGIISKIDVERGQTVSSATPIVSLISLANYQIEASITEIDVAKISVGDEASLTLDAYGPGRVFKARVSQIDTGATIVDGVTTYKTTLDFQDSDLADVRPDMTANVDIQTEKLENVIAIPQRAIINRNGSKIVRISRNELIEEQTVTTGLSGKDGYIEITSGLNEGDIIVTFVND